MCSPISMPGTLVWIGSPLAPSRRTAYWIGHVRLALTVTIIFLLACFLVWRSDLAGLNTLSILVLVILLFGKRLPSCCVRLAHVAGLIKTKGTGRLKSN